MEEEKNDEHKPDQAPAGSRERFWNAARIAEIDRQTPTSAILLSTTAPCGICRIDQELRFAAMKPFAETKGEQ